MASVQWDQEAVPRKRPVAKVRRCEIEGCERTHLARGWCQRHYERWKRSGDPLVGKDLEDGPTKSGISPLPCSKCGGPKERGRGRSLCDACLEDAYETRRDQEPRRLREYFLRSKYGISVEIYEEILASQNGSCAICGGPPSKTFRCFDVDHDHETGKVRGLLCRPCNIGVGFFDRGFYEKARAYLERGASPRQT